MSNSFVSLLFNFSYQDDNNLLVLMIQSFLFSLPSGFPPGKDNFSFVTIPNSQSESKIYIFHVISSVTQKLLRAIFEFVLNFSIIAV